MKRFEASTKIIAGHGAVDALAEFSGKRVMLVTDPFFRENGTAARVAAAAKAEAVEIFAGVKPDPTVALAAEGTAAVKEFQPDLVIALGGGSAMDCAKAMVYFSGRTIPLVTIPTTSGSGSEVTDFAVLTHDGAKHPLVDRKLRPVAAILDDTLLEKLPRGLIADAGFDVLTHAAEAFVAKNAGMISDCLAAEAFRTVYALLPASYAGNTSVRLKIHTAATMAGMAFTQAGLGLCHALSHSLGGLFHVPHGRLNAILLPAVISCNGYASGEKYAKLASAAGIAGSAQTIALRNLKNGLIRLRRELGMPGTLREAGIDPGKLRRSTGDILKAVLEDPCCATNPIQVEDFMVRRILDEVAGND